MMMDRKWHFFVTCVLLATLVLFGAEAAFAQAGDPQDFTANTRGHDTIRLTWTHTAGAGGVDKFSLRYQQNTPASVANPGAGDFSALVTTTRQDVKASTTSTSYSLTIEGLKPAKDYVFGLTALADEGADADEEFATVKTDTADEPDDVRNLMLTPGDGMIMVMWDVATDNGSEVTGYSVEYREEGESAWMESRDGKTGTDTSTDWTLSNLMNGTTYEVRVQACSFDMCGDWTDEEEATPGMTPTPALPLFGAFTLGVGVLAAGRARLRRRREQRQLTR